MKLMREIRFSALPPTGAATNSWAAWPSAAAVAPYLILQAVIEGDVDPRTGFLCHIQALDNLLRTRAIPSIVDTLATAGQDRRTSNSYESLLRRSWNAVHGECPQGTRLRELNLYATPYTVFSIHSGDNRMISVTESFEFSASHRLCCSEFSDEMNREVFGKCANPNGHGHNYVVEVSVAGEPDPATGTVICIQRLESIVKELVIDHFDHKHLNLDCPEFTELNPSVENITTVIWKRLEGQLDPARLTKVRVWETPKTYAEIENGN